MALNFVKQRWINKITISRGHSISNITWSTYIKEFSSVCIPVFFHRNFCGDAQIHKSWNPPHYFSQLLHPRPRWAVTGGMTYLPVCEPSKSVEREDAISSSASQWLWSLFKEWSNDASSCVMLFTGGTSAMLALRLAWLIFQQSVKGTWTDCDYCDCVLTRSHMDAWGS